MQTTSHISRIVTNFLVLCFFCILLFAVGGCGVSLTEAERAEVEPILKLFGTDAILAYIGGVDLDNVDKDRMLKYLKYLVSKGANVNAKNNDGETPLHRAVHFDIKIVKYLVSKGADVNAKDNNGYTPLHSAVYHDIEVVKYLISKGADVNAKTKYDSTPLDLAKELIDSTEIEIKEEKEGENRQQWVEGFTKNLAKYHSIVEYLSSLK